MTVDELVSAINELPLEGRLKIIEWLSDNIREETERQTVACSGKREEEHAENEHT